MKIAGLPEMPDLIHVPTSLELAEQGKAEVVEWTKAGRPAVIRLLPEGEQAIRLAMETNVAIWREHEKKNGKPW